MDNTNIETQPKIIGRAETSTAPAEIMMETSGLVEPPVFTPMESSTEEEVVSSEPIDGSIEVEATTEVPRPSAGFPIKPESKGTSKIVLEKIRNITENL
ncbi:MAG TPA: hypothetical protein PKW94_00530 [Candidatus Dojkabacteria bacterium]|nr:hypothetical protein [Candidatus Dojkabacteria bacterium]HOR05859.1 hypothetical protein [Candidatus Dojkabacteria bacterium]HOT60778.1 hypothetical protein [Candidatus Dojkabacteria bacterium]HQI92551.1 hypothetical protein [Candidatus Dojkabacteria bacterium]